MKTMPILVLLFILMTPNAKVDAADLVLVENGQPRATIVLAAQANEKARFAAEELQTYIEKISGAKLPIADDTAAPHGPLILVGKSRLTDAMKVSIPSGLTNARREEGFLIERKGDRLILAGNDAGPYHGTEYAVYEFLNRLGVRWFMPGDYGEWIPKLPTLTVGNLRILEKPDFIMRNWWLHIVPELAEQERRWKLRNKMNPDPMFATPGDSSARNILPESVYFKSHPEYFAMNPDGSRNPYMPNLTHPRAVEIAAGIIEEYFQKNPGANSYGFAPDDGLPRDYSPETLKINRGFVTMGGRQGVPAELSTTEEWISFVNQVTARVRAKYPDVYIATNGYANRNNPPQGVQLDDHLVIMFAAIWSCTLHAYDDDHCWQKVRQGQMLQQWTTLCKNVWIYGYNYQMLVSALTPLPEIRKLRRDFPLWKKWGVIGFFDENRNVWAEAGIPSRYIRARLEWNANADVDALLEDFYTKWYGKSAQPMRAFYEAIEDAIEKSPLHGHEDRVLPYIYTPSLLTKLRDYLARAEQLADTDTTRLHVRADRLIYEHLEAYMAMSEAELAGQFAEAAEQAERMMDLRKQLHAIHPFYIWHDEARYHSGIWYWGLAERRDFYRMLADRTAGKTGELVTFLPELALFRTDPHDAGVYAEWYKLTTDEETWKPVFTTQPFYMQGYIDKQGHPYTGYMWYRLRVNVPKSARGKKILLYAPVVETEAWGWVNGKFVGYRPYMEAYVRPAPLEFDVTEAIRTGETNEVVLRVSTGLSPEQAASGLLSRLFLYSPKRGSNARSPNAKDG